MMLDGTFQGTCAVDWIIPLISNKLLHILGQGQSQSLFGETFPHPLQLKIDNGCQFFTTQAIEDHGLIDAVEKLRAEMTAQGLHHSGLALLGIAFSQNVLRADIRGHDQNGITKINGSALSVRDTSIIQHLQQNVEHIRMRLFDLIK